MDCRSTWTGLALFALFAGVWLYFATGLPTSEKLLAYEPPLPTNVRGYNGDPVQTFARERRVELSYDEFPPMVIDAFVSAEDDFLQAMAGSITRASSAQCSITSQERRRRPCTRRIDHHQQVAKYLLKDSSYASGGNTREVILAFLLEFAPLRAEILEIYLYPYFPRLQRLRGSGRIAVLFSTRMLTSRPCPRGLTLRRSCPAPANYDPVARPRGPRPAQLCPAGDGHATATSRRQRVMRLDDSGRHDPRWQQREFSPAGGYFMEEVRRDTDASSSAKAAEGSNSLYVGLLLGTRWSRRCRMRPRVVCDGSTSLTAAAACATLSPASTSTRAMGRPA